MKKTIFTLTIAALAAMTSCNNGGSQAGLLPLHPP